MQPDTLPLVAYAYVCRLMHDSMHAGLLIHACMFVCAPALAACLCVVSIISTTKQQTNKTANNKQQQQTTN
jgi:hypothetical protein